MRQFQSSKRDFRFELRKFNADGATEAGVILDMDQFKELKRLLPILQENYEYRLNRG